MTFFDFEIDEKDLASAKFFGDTRRCLVEAFLEENKNDRQINQALIARKIGMDKGTLSKILRGQGNMTLRTLSDIAWALGFVPEVHLHRQNEAKQSNHMPRSFCGAHSAQPMAMEVNAIWKPADARTQAGKTRRSPPRAVASRQEVRFENVS